MKDRFKRVAFFVRAYNDADHFVPLIAEFIINKENPLIVVNTDLSIEDDYRFKYLKTLGEFEIVRDIDAEYVKFSEKKGLVHNLLQKIYLLKRNRKSFIGKIYRYFFYDCNKQMKFLKEKNIGICAFEWSTPYARRTNRKIFFCS